MRLAELPQPAVRAHLCGHGLTLVTGALRTRIRSALPAVADGLASLYADFPVEPDARFADFHVAMARPLGLRRWYRPHALFFFDGRSVFKPLPLNQAFPMLEWGLNWCVTTQIQHRLLFHAAVVARGERALLLPGPPGSGKSTLCAALASCGWRLLSDELAIVDLDDASLQPLARPVSLKNASIAAIRSFAPRAFVSEPCHDTLKGTVAHLRPSRESVDAMRVPGRSAWIVFPEYRPGAATRLTAEAPEAGFFRLLKNAFNYAALGARAFERSVDLVAGSDCYDLVYSNLEEAVARLGELEAGAGAGSTGDVPGAAAGSGAP